jgi:hypothetical protein
MFQFKIKRFVSFQCKSSPQTWSWCQSIFLMHCSCTLLGTSSDAGLVCIGKDGSVPKDKASITWSLKNWEGKLRVKKRKTIQKTREKSRVKHHLLGFLSKVMMTMQIKKTLKRAKIYISSGSNNPWISLKWFDDTWLSLACSLYM